MAKRPPPPPPAPRGSERRAHRRVTLLVQVQIAQQSEVHIMSTVNVSRGGAFVQGNPLDLPGIREGVTVDLVLFTPDDIGEDVSAQAKVVRVEDGWDEQTPNGFGLKFTRISEENRARLSRMLDAPQ